MGGLTRPAVQRAALDEPEEEPPARWADRRRGTAGDWAGAGAGVPPKRAEEVDTVQPQFPDRALGLRHGAGDVVLVGRGAQRQHREAFESLDPGSALHDAVLRHMRCVPY